MNGSQQLNVIVLSAIAAGVSVVLVLAFYVLWQVSGRTSHLVLCVVFIVTTPIIAVICDNEKRKLHRYLKTIEPSQE